MQALKVTRRNRHWFGSIMLFCVYKRITTDKQPIYRQIFADVIVYIFAHWHTTYLIEAVAVYMS